MRNHPFTAVGFVFGGFLFMTEVAPDQAAENLCKYQTRYWPDCANDLKSWGIEDLVGWIPLFLLVVGLGILIVPWVWNRTQKPQQLRAALALEQRQSIHSDLEDHQDDIEFYRQEIRISVENDQSTNTIEGMTILMLEIHGYADPELPAALRVSGSGADKADINPKSLVHFDLAKLIGARLNPAGRGIYLPLVSHKHYIPARSIHVKLQAASKDKDMPAFYAEISIDDGGLLGARFVTNGEIKEPVIVNEWTNRNHILSGGSAASCW